MLFMVVLIILAIIGLGTLLGGAGTAGVAGLGALALVGAFMFKVFFFVLLFGLLAKLLSRGGCGPRYRSWDGYRAGPRARSRRPREPQPSAEDRFEEWHRMAHAREEVDSWVADLPDDGAE